MFLDQEHMKPAIQICLVITTQTVIIEWVTTGKKIIIILITIGAQTILKLIYMYEAVQLYP